MMRRRGLTLIEVLIATVILAILAATCAPAIARALQSLRAGPAADLFEVSRIADAVISDPETHGIDDWRLVSTTTIAPSTEIDFGSITLQVLTSSDPESTRAWMRFTDGEGRSVYRWLHLPLNDEEAQP